MVANLITDAYIMTPIHPTVGAMGYEEMNEWTSCVDDENIVWFYIVCSHD